MCDNVIDPDNKNTVLSLCMVYGGLIKTNYTEIFISYFA